METPIWGIDLGGTKLEGIILQSISNPVPVARLRIDTEAAGGYAHLIDRISLLVDALRQQSGLQPQRIGIGTPGISDPRLGTMKNCNTTILNRMPLKKDLEKKLGVPVALANDANCFALAETQWGAARHFDPLPEMVFGIIMGTGVGGGLVTGGRVWNGHHGIAGEWGHNFLDDSGGACYCGKSGCVETVLSGPALERFYTGLTGRSLPLKIIAALHQQGSDEAATQTIRRLTHFFGKAVSVVTNLLDPDLIIVGGGVGNIDVLYTDGIRSLEKTIFNTRSEVPVVKPVLGDSAGVFGAAALVQ